MHLLRRVQGILFSLFLAASVVSPALGQPATQGSQTLTVTVTDKKHNLVNDLKADDFKVYDNDQPQHITSFSHSDVPVCMGLLVDSSGSMRPMQNAVIAAMLELVKAGNPEDRIFVVNFNEHPYLDQEFTKDLNLIEQALRRANPRGGTALYDAVIASAEHVAKSPGCEKRVLVVISDGEDNQSTKTLQETIDAVQNSGSTLVYALGLESNSVSSNVPRDRHTLEKLATPTGGELFFVSNPRDLSKAVPKLAEEIRNQYSITYIPTDPQRNGTYHKVRVELPAPEQKDLKVRARTGYIARR